MENIYFPSMNVADVSEPENAVIGPQTTFSRAGEQLVSGSYFASSFDNTDGEWDSILSEFTTENCTQDPGTFNTSLLSTSPVTSASFRNTPDTVVSNACLNGSGLVEGVDDTVMTREADFRGETTGNICRQQTNTLTSALPTTKNDFHEPTIDPAAHFTMATSQTSKMATSGAIVCSAATLGTSQIEPALVMNTSPRHRVSRLPPDVGADGQIRYLEPHEIPEQQPGITQPATRNVTDGSIVLPPELERHMYYPSRRKSSRPRQQSQAQIQMQQMQPQRPQSQGIQHAPDPQQMHNFQPLHYLQQPQISVSSPDYPHRQINSQDLYAIQSVQPSSQSQHGNFHLHQPNAMASHQLQHQLNFQNFQKPIKEVTFQPDIHAPIAAAQQSRQSMPSVHGHLPMQEQPVPQDLCLDLYYTGDGYESYSARAEKPPNTNSHEWLRNRDFRSTWNLADIYTNWLDTSPNTVEPHVKPFSKKDIKLGMSSQDATKAAITEGFVRGAGWAAKLFLMQIEKEMRESGTMLGFRPHKKVQKAELEQSVIEHIVRTNPPSIHGAQCSNVIAWAYDEFYPGVFRQEGNNGRPRSPQEIFDAWKTLSENITTDQLKPVLFDTSTGLSVMTDIQPSRPPVAQVRSFATQPGQEPSIRISQFPVPEAKNGHIAVKNGENFFTNPEGPATMKLQQMKRAEFMASRSTAKPQGARQPPKTAEEKKENRNRKADEKIGWILTGQSRTIQHEHMTAVSYQCSDGEFRILEGQRLEEAKERTLKRQKKQQGDRAMADAAGTNVSCLATNESPSTVLMDAESRNNASAALISADYSRETGNVARLDGSQPNVTAADNTSSSKSIAVSSVTPTVTNDDNMIFSDFYKSSRSPLARLRNGNPQLSTKLPTASPDWVGDEYADLLSKDKAKNKEAVRRYLADKVRYDWVFDWPAQQAPKSAGKPLGEVQDQSAKLELATADAVEVDAPANSGAADEGYQVDNSDLDSDDESVYSVVSMDNIHWRPRAEWTSDIDEDSDSSSFDDSQSSLPLAALARQAKRRRAIREEASWNPGLACFEARRDAWTGAKTVRVRSKPASATPSQPISPRSPRRFFFRRSMSSSPPTAAAVLAVANATSADLCGTASDSSSAPQDELRKADSHADGSTANTPATSTTTEEMRTYPVETLLPVAQPILPPNNPLRASITPNVYLGLYDKVILHNLQPSCPINLADMLRSCVTGWKRDGEWPPRSTPCNPPVAKKKSSRHRKLTTGSTSAAQPTEAEAKSSRRLSFNLLNRDNEESRAGKGFRRSLQRAFGMAPLPGLGETA
ncbi:mitochondrial AAA ATPase [Cordyceps javanica]|uniref:Mitochondrial AAA ATPase n=1 Tax=Cordyceps javanica TaxID=43265 RepID=A0A545VEB7_9HYPO|nr:mitochondrial AAA ATPase [Cordyceps javanica]TQW11271.1 mitochondrial AAA ATPase [Cordyceps javanica]